mmetsp:Transcript_36703/g.105217  ORF Transcript_36703/g.105217 Transcript_36703/m.105217 type:complete len:97 (-) Transcript_36703:40-330(-)
MSIAIGGSMARLVDGWMDGWRALLPPADGQTDIWTDRETGSDGWYLSAPSCLRVSVCLYQVVSLSIMCVSLSLCVWCFYVSWPLTGLLCDCLSDRH